MSGKDIIIMSQTELKRLHIIRKVLEKKLKQVEAASILGLTDRHIRRMVDRVKTEGDLGIIHKSRGRPSNRKLPQELKDNVIKLYKQNYFDFGPTLANEKLLEINNIDIGSQTLRNWLIEEGLWQVAHRRRKHRQWRQRKFHFGEMLQMDGSHHNWFEGRGQEAVLMGYIDDATNNVFARFYEYEGTFPAMDSFKRYVRRYGIPHSVYLDKHTTYKSTAKPTIEDELNNTKPLSQFERAVKELGVELIHAESAPAKGRIERLFKTFQDRLVKEMRLKNVKTLAEANRFLSYYLPIYNKRFSFTALKKGNLHRPLTQDINLEAVLCIKTEHTLRNDFTIVHNKKFYQILDRTNTKTVAVLEKMNGAILITCSGKSLGYKEITQMPKKAAPKITIERTYRPSMDHPWKRPMYEKRVAFVRAQKEKELLLTKT